MNPFAPSLPAEALVLDAASLRPESLSMPALMRELNLQQRPSWLLVKLMNALEQQRQKKGLGWSRAWNKTGLTIFRTHTHHLATDMDYFAPVMPVLDRALARVRPAIRDFAHELLQDPARMAFTFYHNNDPGDRQSEGLTISLGRRVPRDKTKRDRLDVILEDEREEGRVDGLVDRVRVYVCPWRDFGRDRSFHLTEWIRPPAEELRLAQTLYANCVARYHEWKHEPTRQWSHWSARYIDYFGPREFIPQGSSFT